MYNINVNLTQLLNRVTVECVEVLCHLAPKLCLTTAVNTVLPPSVALPTPWSRAPVMSVKNISVPNMSHVGEKIAHVGEKVQDVASDAGEKVASAVDRMLPGTNKSVPAASGSSGRKNLRLSHQRSGPSEAERWAETAGGSGTGGRNNAAAITSGKSRIRWLRARHAGNHAGRIDPGLGTIRRHWM